MPTTEWMRDRLQQAVDGGEVVALTGPRSVSEPGPDTSAPTELPKRRRFNERPYVVRTYINGGTDWYDNAAFYYRHDAKWWAENMAEQGESAAVVVDIRYDDN